MSLLPPRKKKPVKFDHVPESTPLNTFALYKEFDGRVVVAPDDRVPKNGTLIEFVAAVDWQEARDKQDFRFQHREGYGFYED